MILVIGDLHFKDSLGYADYISDRRVGEKKKVLDLIVEESKNCEDVVLMGDNFNSKNNTSETNREFVEFIERFQDKRVHIIAGNHEKRGDGKTAIDFLGEIERPNWHIYTNNVATVREKDGFKMDFLPFLLKSELGVDSDEAGAAEILARLGVGDILFAHHAISETSVKGLRTELMKEIVLPKSELEKKYKLVIAGHIHEPQQVDQTVITGSVFTEAVGEHEKFIWKIGNDLSVEKIKLPCREIHKLENPTTKQLTSIPKESIVKVIITDKKFKTEEIKLALERFDASLFIENIPNERKKAHKIESGAAFDFSIESLLKLYAEEKEVNYGVLIKGLNLIS